MTLKKVQLEVWELHCNKCGSKFEDDGVDFIPVYFDDGQAMESAAEQDWYLRDEGEFCPDCGDPDDDIEAR